MKKGFTLIELLAVIVILALIAVIATPIILGIINDSKKSAFKDTAYGIIEAAKNEYVEEMYNNQSPSSIKFTYTNGVESSSVAGKSLNYNGAKPDNGAIILTNTGDVAIAIHDGTNCAYKNYNDSDVAIDVKPFIECNIDYSVGVNIPNLAQGMTPIKWNGTNWTNTTVDDKDWYDYANKKWANAKTADGSMWVWIPRYIYKISSGWHSNTAGIIEVQFSNGTDDNWNSSIIGNINTDATSNASNNTWTNQPGFTFGTTQLTGIWVAKFEATAVEGVANGYVSDYSCPNTNDNVTTKTIKIIPNVASWRCITVGNIFTVSRNMEASNIYGWNVSSGLQGNGTYTNDSNNLDTHMMKNVEWGTVVYLSKSIYGQNTNEIWINNSRDYITGCAGDSVNAAGNSSGCTNSYETSNGINASTTGTIYGIYDLSGGAWEYVASYLNNGHVNLNQGSSIINADNKYKDFYSVATTDTQANNYPLAIEKKGDAVYEISNNTGGAYAWFNDYAYMATTSNPWFVRSGRFNYGANAGAFIFRNIWGGVYSSNSFRPVIVVGNGL